MSNTVNINHILDIAELQESVLLIALASAQIEASMTEGEHSVDALIDSFKSMSTRLRMLARDESENSDITELKHEIDMSIIAFQFYDRLNQRLEHVNNSLVMLCELVSDNAKLKEPERWDALKLRIRQSYSMESEHDLFKMLYDDGLTAETALKKIKVRSAIKPEVSAEDQDDIELF